MTEKTDRQLLLEAHANIAVLLERTRGLPKLYGKVAGQSTAIKFLWAGMVLPSIGLALRIIGVI